MNGPNAVKNFDCDGNELMNNCTRLHNATDSIKGGTEESTSDQSVSLWENFCGVNTRLAQTRKIISYLKPLIDASPTNDSSSLLRDLNNDLIILNVLSVQLQNSLADQSKLVHKHNANSNVSKSIHSLSNNYDSSTENFLHQKKCCEY
jgi:hypothetical protein